MTKVWHWIGLNAAGAILRVETWHSLGWGFFSGVGNKFRRKFGKREAEPGLGKIKNFIDNVKQNIKRKLGKREAEPGHLRIRNKYNSVKRKVSQKVQNKLNKIRSFFVSLGNKLRGKF